MQLKKKSRYVQTSSFHPASLVSKMTFTIVRVEPLFVLLIFPPKERRPRATPPPPPPPKKNHLNTVGTIEICA